MKKRVKASDRRVIQSDRLMKREREVDQSKIIKVFLVLYVTNNSSTYSDYFNIDKVYFLSKKEGICFTNFVFMFCFFL